VLKIDPLEIHNDDLTQVCGEILGLPVLLWCPEDTEKRNLAFMRQRIAFAKEYANATAN
jgi:hypothetical protein